MTKATYRRKALPFLLSDFQGKCAYCLDPKEFRAPSQNQVDHFNCKIKSRERNYYRNLMLACAACNLSKHDKPVTNPYNSRQRLLNCTEENEFPEHIEEDANGQWKPISDAGLYHLESIGLTADCHRAKRAARRQMLEKILSLATTAIHYKTVNPSGVHREMMDTIRLLLDVLNNFPPIVTKSGVLSAKDWLKIKGVDLGAV
jgi:hypothetical protein